MVDKEYYDSHGRVVQQGDKVVTYSSITRDRSEAEVVGFDRGGGRCIIQYPSANHQTTVSQRATQQPNAIVSLTAREEGRSSTYFPGKQEFEGKQEVRSQIIGLLKAKGIKWDDEINTGVSIGELLPDNAYATADDILEIVEGAREGPLKGQVAEKRNLDQSFIRNVIQRVKVKENGQISDYPDDLFYKYSRSIIARVNEKEAFSENDQNAPKRLEDALGKENFSRWCKVNKVEGLSEQLQQEDKKDFPYAKVAVTLGAAGYALFAGNDKKPEGHNPDQPEKKQNWFQRNFKTFARVITALLAVDLVQGMVRGQPSLTEQGIDKFTDMINRQRANTPAQGHQKS